jgi:glycosyltransferase involved in cell wall biosynthesis
VLEARHEIQEQEPEMSLVSVIIPSYNHADFIMLAVDSVLSQTHADLELIIIDDGSKDDTLVRLQEFCDPRCQVHHQSNQGAHSAINRGLALAQGDYLTILNSDDIYAPNRLQRLVEEIMIGNDDLLATYIEVINHKGKTLGVKEGWRNMLPWEIPNLKESFLVTDDFALNLLATNFVATTSNIFIRRSVYEEVGGMRKLRFAHDWDFLLRVARHRRCRLIPEPLLKYRIHPDNTISKDRSEMLFEACWNMAVHSVHFADRFRGHVGHEQINLHALSMLWNSLNTQGNNHVAWRISHLMQIMQSTGIQDAEEVFLENNALRRQFIDQIRI